MGCGYEDDKAGFMINTFELKIVFPTCLCREAIHLQRLRTFWLHTCAYERDDHYPICSKLHCGGVLTLCGLYYAYSYTVTIFPGPVYSFAVLYTEKLVFQCVTLQS